jgi:signal transduction histidine kinase
MGPSPESTPPPAMADGVDLISAAERIAAAALRFIGGRQVHLYRIDASGAMACMATTPGDPLEADVVRRAQAPREGPPPGTPHVLDDGIEALATVALRAGGELLGRLVVADGTGRRYTEGELALLSVFAEGAARLLEHGRLQADLARERRAATEVARVAHLVGETLDLHSTGERIAEAVLGVLGVHSSAIRLFRPDGALEPIALGGRARQYAGSGDVVPAGVGLVGRVAVEGRPLWTEDIRRETRFETSQEIRDRNALVGTVAGLAVPLRAAGEVVGVLSVGSATPRTFSEADIALMVTFADQAAIVINNCLARDTLAKHTERLRILHEIDRAMIAEMAPVAIAEAVLVRLRDLLGVPRAIVNLFDFEAGEIEWLAAVGRRRMHLGPGVRYPMRLAGDVEALRRGEPQVIDVRALPPSPETEALLGSGVQAYMMVPMIVSGQLIGAVSFGGDQADFPEEQVSIAREAANQLAIAIAQARLHERVERQAAELEQRVKDRTRQLEAAIRELDTFVHTVSHDLKAPLRGMEGFAQALEEDYGGGLDDAGRRYISMIRTAATRMGELIDDLLAYSRIEHRVIQRGPVRLGSLLAPLLEDLRDEIESRGLTVSEDLALPEVIGEREGLREALANLLSNAVKFSPKGGGAITVRSYREGGEAVIAVTDGGIGFDMKHHDRIFGIFERLHRNEEYPGTGVGLAIVRKVAERHGGRTWAQSTIGSGSTFFIAIPAA